MTRRLRPKGFSLLEMAIVLVIIGVVMSAVMVGTDVLRHAKGQKAFSSFVLGWQEAFAQYTRLTGRVPADDVNRPTNMIRQRLDLPLCGTELSDAFLKEGIRIPEGRGTGLESEYLYQDSTGSPRVLRICFATVNWAVQGASANSFVRVARHAMTLSGLTAELAMQMDVLVDGRASARFGQFRSQAAHHLTNANEAQWGALAAGDRDSARTEVQALFEMF